MPKPTARGGCAVDVHPPLSSLCRLSSALSVERAVALLCFALPCLALPYSSVLHLHLRLRPR